jgi:AcrR family transcriptional regulator
VAAAPVPSSREKILDVAEALFARSGYAGVGLREVAERVGLGKSSLFHHFPTKMSLDVEVLERVLASIEGRVADALGPARPPTEKLEAWTDALVDALAEHPTWARLLLRGLFEDDTFPAQPTPETERLERRLQSLVQGFQRLVREGVESGDFRRVSEADAVQTMIGATVYHFASGEFGEGVIGGPLFSAEAVARRKREVKAFLRGGLSRPAKHPEPGR